MIILQILFGIYILLTVAFFLSFYKDKKDFQEIVSENYPNMSKLPFLITLILTSMFWFIFIDSIEITIDKDEESTN